MPGGFDCYDIAASTVQGDLTLTAGIVQIGQGSPDLQSQVARDQSATTDRPKPTSANLLYGAMNGSNPHLTGKSLYATL